MISRTLRAKTTWIVTGVAGFLTVPITIGLWALLAPGYHKADQVMADKERSRIEQFFRLRMMGARGAARDWGVSNGMARWIGSRDSGYFADNLQLDNLASHGFRSVEIFDSTGKSILSLGFTAPSPFLAGQVELEAGRWVRKRDTAGFHKWFLKERGIWALVGQPVYGVSSPGPPAVGLLVATLRIDSAGFFSGVVDSTDHREPVGMFDDSMSVAGGFPLAGPPDPPRPPGFPGPPGAPGQFAPPFPPGPPPGDPRFSLRIWRGAWVEGRRTLVLLVGCVFLFTLFFVAILVRLLDRIILRRLAALHEDLERIKAHPRGERIRDLGDDEIGGFARQLNTTFQALEDSRRHLADAQRIARIGFLRLEPGTLRTRVSVEHIETAGLDVPPVEFELPFEEYLQRFVHPDDRDRLRSWAEYAGNQDPAEISGELEYRTLGRDDEVRQLSAACRKRDQEGDALFRVVQDVTERRRMEDEILRGSLYDALTGLPNRSLLLDRIRSIVDHPGHARCTVLVFALDRFQAINSSLGRDVGEGLLLGISVRLAGGLPPEATVGRMSHESFCVLLETDELEEINRVAERLRKVVRAPMPLGDRELVLTASIGVARARSGECSAEELLSRAESAQYQAAGRGGDCIAFFDEERSRRAREKVDLEMELGNAVPDQLELHYQPIVHLSDGRLAGFEALLRWRHPERGLVSPMLFIPIAERTGLIHEMGLWVMEEAMRLEARWQAEFGETAPFMSINLSVKQFLHDDLADQIRSCLEKTGVRPSGIKLEITESALSEDPARVTQLLETLVAKGISFSLDDFGTGYSSLGYLSSFPVKTLKVDKSFVDQLGEDGKKTRITSAIVNLAHTLGMDVVAEGIEHEAQWNRLKELECEFGQGYHFSRPLPLAQALDFVAKHANR